MRRRTDEAPENHEPAGTRDAAAAPNDARRVDPARENERRLSASESRYRTLAEVLPSQVWTALPDGSLDYVNQRVLEYFGRTFDEMIGAGWQAVIHEDDLPTVLHRWVHALTTGSPYEVEFRLRRARDGTYRWHLGRAEPIRDASGELVQWIGANTDIDDARRLIEEQKQSEQALAEKERRLRLALDAGQMGTWEWDITTGAVHWSDTLERIRGIPVGSFPGTFEAYQRDMHPEDRERVVASVQSALDERRDHSVLYRIIRPDDGAVRWLEAFGRFSFDDTGRPVRLGGVCRDVTERVSADEARHALGAAQAARAQAEEARRTTQRILEGITDSFAVYDRDWRFVFANEATTRELGLLPAEVFGKTLWDVAPQAVGTRFHGELERAMRDGQAVTVEEYYAPLDRWIELRAYPLGAIGLAVYSRDVTPRKREEQLRARLARYAALRADVVGAFAGEAHLAVKLGSCCEALERHLDASFARVWLTDADGEWLELCTRANGDKLVDGAHERVRMGELEVGTIAAERRALVTNDIAGDPRVIDKAWAARHALVAFVGYPLVVGDRLEGVLTLFSKSAVPEDALNAIGAVGDAVAQGVARAHAETEREAHARELARSNTELEQFAYVASHDLQEPLRTVASYNQLLARRYQGKLGKDADDFIAFSVEGVSRMQRVINDLLAFSRVGTRKKEFELVPMRRVFDLACVNLKKAIEEQQAVVSADDLPDVMGDDGQLVQLLQNLLANAIKFHGSDRPRVHVTARRADEAWEFSVSDNGIGIEQQYFERIFVIFQRLHSRERYDGTGIGLAICKKIVERHGGKIWIRSTPDIGSTVFFSLPSITRRRVSTP